MISAKLEYPLRLRPHHLICLQLFQGRGYDEAFTARMNEVYAIMKTRPETRFTLVEGADDLCAACPNRAGDNACALGGDVAERDRNALDALGFRAGDTVSFAEVRARTAERMDEEAFIRVCDKCNWLKAGVCSYEALSRVLPREAITPSPKLTDE